MTKEIHGCVCYDSDLFTIPAALVGFIFSFESNLVLYPSNVMGFRRNLTVFLFSSTLIKRLLPCFKRGLWFRPATLTELKWRFAGFHGGEYEDDR